MSDMTDNEVLSVLSKMDEEERTYNSLFGARRYVRDVILKYQEAKKFLSEVEAVKANHESSIANLAKQLEEGQQKIANQLQAETNVMNSTLEDIGKQLTKVRNEYDEASKKLKEKEEEFTKRSLWLDTEIKLKEAELTKIATNFEAFKVAHNL